MGGFGRWLKGATRIRFDDRTLGNLTRNVATGAGAVIGGPAGLALAAGGNALGAGIQKGGNLRGALKAAGQGAAAAGGLRAGAGLLRNVATGAGGTAGGTAATAADAAPEVGTLAPPASGGLAPLPMSAAADVGTGALPGFQPPSGVLRSALNTTGSFVKNNPTAVAMGLQGAGGLATAGAENRRNDAETQLLEQRLGESTYDFEQRKRRDAALAPLWSQLGSTFSANNASVARNPYLPAS